MAAYNLPAPPTDINSLSYAYWRRQAWFTIAQRSAECAIRFQGCPGAGRFCAAMERATRTSMRDAMHWHGEVLRLGGR